jgi:hypothetical protein
MRSTPAFAVDARTVQIHGRKLRQGLKGKIHTSKDVLPMKFVGSELEEGPRGDLKFHTNNRN